MNSTRFTAYGISERAVSECTAHNAKLSSISRPCGMNDLLRIGPQRITTARMKDTIQLAFVRGYAAINLYDEESCYMSILLVEKGDTKMHIFCQSANGHGYVMHLSVALAPNHPLNKKPVIKAIY